MRSVGRIRRRSGYVSITAIQLRWRYGVGVVCGGSGSASGMLLHGAAAYGMVVAWRIIANNIHTNNNRQSISNMACMTWLCGII